ncbi:RICIN domain-containing protein [Streptomyces violascens]|uniref:RICIN domain-containing protein n=1 Tax=Streptomyces violascens TaxID=67381 RepID=UPI0035711AAA
MVSEVSGKCLEVDNSSTNDGARVQQWDCKGQAGSKWETVLRLLRSRWCSQCAARSWLGARRRRPDSRRTGR